MTNLEFLYLRNGQFYFQIICLIRLKFQEINNINSKRTHEDYGLITSFFIPKENATKDISLLYPRKPTPVPYNL